MGFSDVAGPGAPVPTFALVCGGRFANVRAKGAPEISDSGAVDLTFASRTGGATEANVKSTAPGRRVWSPNRWRGGTHGQGEDGSHADRFEAGGNEGFYDNASISASFKSPGTMMT